MFENSIKNCCRLCGTSGSDLLAIEPNLASRIQILFHLKIQTNNEEDKLSKDICRNCLFSVSSCWTFYLQVQRVQEELRTDTCFTQKQLNDLLCSDKVGPPAKVLPLKKPKRRGIEKYSLAEKTLLDSNERWSDYPWFCLICEKHFANIHTYKRHACYKEEKRYFCVDCSKPFKIYNQLISHVKKLHWVRLKNHLLLQCDVCKRWSNSEEQQDLHRKQNHAEAAPRLEPEMPLYFSLECQICGKTFANKWTLKKHAQLHSNKIHCVCVVCGKGFRNSAGLRYHTKKYHTNAEQQFHCDQCGKIFPTKGHFGVHMIMHSKERPFACDICKKTFKTQYNANIHKTRHTAIKQHVCEICGKDFNCLINLKCHRKMHTLKNVHNCSFCDKRFKMKPNLISHERQHTGEQPFSCSVCQRKFTSPSNRLKHTRRMH